MPEADCSQQPSLRWRVRTRRLPCSHATSRKTSWSEAVRADANCHSLLRSCPPCCCHSGCLASGGLLGPGVARWFSAPIWVGQQRRISGAWSAAAAHGCESEDGTCPIHTPRSRRRSQSLAICFFPQEKYIKVGANIFLLRWILGLPPCHFGFFS